MEALVEQITSLEEENEIEQANQIICNTLNQYPNEFTIQLMYLSFQMRNFMELMLDDQQLQETTNQIFQRAIKSLNTNDASSASMNVLTDDQKLQQSSFYGLLGLFLSRVIGDPEGTVEAFQKSLDLNPNNIDSLFCFASYLDRACGDGISACRLYERVLQMEPSHVSTLNNYAAILIEQARASASRQKAIPIFDQARAYLERAESLAPGFPAYNLACISALLMQMSTKNHKKTHEEDCKRWLLAAMESMGATLMDTLENDSDFDGIRALPWFSEITERLESMRMSDDEEEEEEEEETSKGAHTSWEAGDEYNVHFMGVSLRIAEPEHRYVPHAENENVCPTGGTIWNASFAILRFVESESTAAYWAGKNILDMSAGVGLVGCALARVGAKVTLTDIGSNQLRLLEANVNKNQLAESCYIQELPWGDTSKIQNLVATRGGTFDIVFASDLLYIAIRDDICDALYTTIVSLVHASNQMIFTFEERVPTKEIDFINRIRSAGIVVEERAVKDQHLVDIKNEANLDGIFAGLAIHDDPVIRIYYFTCNKTKSIS